MPAVARKDYGANAIVAPSNETMRLINSINSPYSAQATGMDLVPGRIEKISQAQLNALTTNTRVLLGNAEGYVKTVTQVESVTTAVVIATLDKEKEEILKTYTAAEILNSGNIIFVA